MVAQDNPCSYSLCCSEGKDGVQHYRLVAHLMNCFSVYIAITIFSAVCNGVIVFTDYTVISVMSSRDLWVAKKNISLDGVAVTLLSRDAHHRGHPLCG